MRKLILFLLVFVSAKVSAQVYQEMPQYGYRANRMAFDSTLQIPTVCGVPTLKSVVKTNKSGAIAYDSCNARFYAYNPKTLTWTAITGGGGASTDTTSLSNRINLKIDSLKRSNDSVYAYRNGTRVFQFKDSVGGGNTIDTTNQFVKRLTRTPGKDSIIYFVGANRFAIKDSVGGGASDTIYTQSPIMYITRNDSNIIFFNADTANVWRGGGVAVDTIYRTLGKDSIFYKKNNITYAIKDSVGTNPAPVGYYGAFQDTTTQTAALINTAYPVNLRLTDLSNGITIANNSKIKITNAGIYNIQFSLQLEKIGGSGNMIADIWIRKNGVNIPSTTGKVVLTGSANASPVVAAWNYVIAVSSNDSLELMWSTTNDNVVIKASPATSPHPSIPSAILTVTQQSGIMAGTGISPLDTANMLLPYLRKIDTTSLSNRIDLKLSTADTSVFQRKSLSAYSIMANKTNATANVTAQSFRDTSGVYDGTITWTGTTAPFGTTNHSYRLTQVGKCVTLHIALVYASNGSALTAVQMTLPTGAPTPVQPTGLTGSINNLYPMSVQLSTTASVLANVIARNALRNNNAANGFELFSIFGSTAIAQCNVTVQYWTN